MVISKKRSKHGNSEYAGDQGTEHDHAAMEYTKLKEGPSTVHEGGAEPEPFVMLRKRFILTVLLFWGFFIVFCLRANFSIAIVAMTTEYPPNTTFAKIDVYDWDTDTQGLLLSGFFYGYISTQLIGGILANKFGGKWLYGIAVLTAGGLSAIVPLVARVHYGLLIAVRILTGAAEGFTWAGVFALFRHWAPFTEKSRMVTVVSAGSFIGTVFSFPVSSEIDTYLGWHAIFYIFGPLAMTWGIIWLIVVHERPSDHPCITQAELQHLQRNTTVLDHDPGFPPVEHLITCLPLWAMAVAQFVDHWGNYTILTEYPTFMKEVLNFDMDEIGYVAALPYLAMGLSVMSSGYIADFLIGRGILSTTATRKLFVCIAFSCCAVCMTIAALRLKLVPAVVCLTMAIGFTGFSHAGYLAIPLDIAPKYASIVFGISNTIATMAGILSPTVTGFVVKNKTADDWRIVFFIAAAIYITGILFFGVFASGKVQSWAEVTPTDYKTFSSTTVVEKKTEK